jgi:quinol-cytochrome oxidoreductase complex cytochrome b subunit
MFNKDTVIIFNFFSCLISAILLSVSLSKKLLLNKFNNQKLAIIIPLWITIFLPFIGLSSLKKINNKYPWNITLSIIISYIIVVTLVGLNSYIIHEFKIEESDKEKEDERKNIRSRAIGSLVFLFFVQVPILTSIDKK